MRPWLRVAREGRGPECCSSISDCGSPMSLTLVQPSPRRVALLLWISTAVVLAALLGASTAAAETKVENAVAGQTRAQLRWEETPGEFGSEISNTHLGIARGNRLHVNEDVPKLCES